MDVTLELWYHQPIRYGTTICTPRHGCVEGPLTWSNRPSENLTVISLTLMYPNYHTLPYHTTSYGHISPAIGDCARQQSLSLQHLPFSHRRHYEAVFLLCMKDDQGLRQRATNLAADDKAPSPAAASNEDDSMVGHRRGPVLAYPRGGSLATSRQTLSNYKNKIFLALGATILYTAFLYQSGKLYRRQEPLHSLLHDSSHPRNRLLSFQRRCPLLSWRHV